MMLAQISGFVLNSLGLKRLRRHAAEALAGVVLVAISPMPLLAQNVETPGEQGRGNSDPEPLCTVFEADEEVGREGEAAREAATIVATCGENGFILGRAQTFEAAVHRESGAVAVVMRRGPNQQVWLFSQTEDGTVILDPVTFEFARAVGRAPTAGLGDVVVELIAFEQTGRILLLPSGREGARPARVAEVAMRDRLTRAVRRPEREGAE